MTAREAALQSGVRLPDLGRELHSAANLFDGLAYGSWPGDKTQYDQMVSLHEAIAATRPLPTAAGDSALALAQGSAS
jgi:hypothetical protein